MQPSTGLADPTRTIASFAITQGGPLVVHEQPPRLTLKGMQLGVDAIESAASRARGALRSATRGMGKDAGTGLTRFLGGGGKWVVAAGLGVAAAGAAYALLGPHMNVYKSSYNYMVDRYSYHNVATSHTWAWDLRAALAYSGVAGAVTGISAFIASWAGCKAYSRNAARRTLEPAHLKQLEAMHEAAAERPLERAAIAKVADDALAELDEREVYQDPAATALLRDIAADRDLGDVQAVRENERHRAFCAALQRLEMDSKQPVVERVDSLLQHWQELPALERDAIKGDVRKRLFDGVVPRLEDVPFREAKRLLNALN